MTNLEKVIELITKQQEGLDEGSPAFCVGEQLKDIATREDLSAELLAQDLENEDMSLVKAEAQIRKYADENHKKAKCFCVTPKVAEGILRKFYGLSSPDDTGSKPAPKQSSSFIDLSDFL